MRQSYRQHGTRQSDVGQGKKKALQTIGFKGQYNFRPGAMKAAPGQRNTKRLYRVIVGILSVILPRQVCSLQDIAQAMIHTVQQGYIRPVLEIRDIKALGKG